MYSALLLKAINHFQIRLYVYIYIRVYIILVPNAHLEETKPKIKKILNFILHRVFFVDSIYTIGRIYWTARTPRNMVNNKLFR